MYPSHFNYYITIFQIQFHCALTIFFFLSLFLCSSLLLSLFSFLLSLPHLYLLPIVINHSVQSLCFFPFITFSFFSPFLSLSLLFTSCSSHSVTQFALQNRHCMLYYDPPFLFQYQYNNPF